MRHDDLIFDRFTRGIIRRKIRQLVSRAIFAPQDQEDLEQTLFSLLLAGLHLFDPARAHHHVFVTTLVERAVAQILRAKRAKKRNGRVRSLEDEEAVEGRRPNGKKPGRSHVDQFDLAYDLGEVLNSLSKPARELAERLMHDTLSQVSRDMRRPRSTLQREVQSIRRRFEDASLEDYL